MLDLDFMIRSLAAILPPGLPVLLIHPYPSYAQQAGGPGGDALGMEAIYLDYTHAGRLVSVLAPPW